jgi:hypothetical protein
MVAERRCSQLKRYNVDGETPGRLANSTSSIAERVSTLGSLNIGSIAVAGDLLRRAIARKTGMNGQSTEARVRSRVSAFPPDPMDQIEVAEDTTYRGSLILFPQPEPCHL